MLSLSEEERNQAAKDSLKHDMGSLIKEKVEQRSGRKTEQYTYDMSRLPRFNCH
jgi:hypothetical protein